MATVTPRGKTSFFKAHVLPALFIFVIPALSAWFFAYAESSTDQEFLTHIESQIDHQRDTNGVQKLEARHFYENAPVSEIMASDDPKMVRLQPMFEGAKLRYTTFRWMQRIAWLCLATIPITLIIVGVSVAFSFRSLSAQYYALRLGWPVLQISAAIQVVGQAVLAAELSFWLTAIFGHVYAVKLIFIIGLLAVLAVVALFKAIFARIDDRLAVNGVSVSEADAPNLWQRVRGMAAQLQTPAPDRITVGIDPSFFVTEHPVTLGKELHRGRTLYLSLPMLKVLAVDEADAILGHELAHFSGQDTFWSRKIAPLTARFATYLRTLAGGLSLIVAHFMNVFWKLYNLSIHKLRREREFRADRIGAELVSKEAMKRALVKTTCYCEYRGKTEAAILNKPRFDANLNLGGDLERGYAGFLETFAQNNRAADERVPHPFDTHPTLHNRLEQLGFDVHAALRSAEIQQPAADTWYDEISAAASLEEKMWTERQEALKAFHNQTIAWRLLPKDEEETAVVRQHFPRMAFRNKRGKEAVLEFDALQLPDENRLIRFRNILQARLVNQLGSGKRLMLKYRIDGTPKTTTWKLSAKEFVGEKGELLQFFLHYYSRYKTAEKASQQISA